MNVLIVGYPRSGNTYLTRLIADILDSPSTGYKNAKPLGEEGHNRKGPYRVMQLHLKPILEDKGEMLPSAWGLSIPRYDGTPVFHIVRDPRDIAVSADHYWNVNNLDKTLSAMINGTNPLKSVGPWRLWIEHWLEHDFPVLVKYEELVNDTMRTITQLIAGLDYDPKRVSGAVERQSFESRRRMTRRGEIALNYGQTIQLHHLRKGVAGDWENHFTNNQKVLARETWGVTASRLGYVL